MFSVYSDSVWTSWIIHEAKLITEMIPMKLRSCSSGPCSSARLKYSAIVTTFHQPHLSIRASFTFARAMMHLFSRTCYFADHIFSVCPPFAILPSSVFHASWPLAWVSSSSPQPPFQTKVQVNRSASSSSAWPDWSSRLKSQRLQDKSFLSKNLLDNQTKNN